MVKPSPASARTKPSPASAGTRTGRPPLAVWKKCLFSLIVGALFFVALELFLAACGITPVVQEEDPTIGFSSYIPLFVEDESLGQYVLNPVKADHFNSQQFPISKSTNTFRIFCLGGSTTYGRPYGDKTSFCGWLREFLPTADPSENWEVINAGGISYASYRLATISEELVHYQPDLFIIYSGHNEFLERRTYASHFGRLAALDRLSELLIHSRTYAVIRIVLSKKAVAPRDSASKFMMPAEVDTVLGGTVGPEAYKRDDKLKRQVLHHYRLNMKRMIRVARSAGAQVILVVPAANVRDCSPFRSTVGDGLAIERQRTFLELVNQARGSLDEGNAEAALKSANQALEIEERFAEVHYLRGRALVDLGRHKEARQSFLLALNEDVCPLRALTDIQQIVTDAAKEENVPCVNFADVVSAAAEHNIPGNDLFLDHVHPTIRGNRMLATAILDEMVRSEMLEPQETWGQTVIDQIAARVEGSLDRRQHGIALRNLSLVLGWAGKKEESWRLVFQAVELAPDDPETQFNAGLVRQEMDDRVGAEKHYRRVLELGSFVDAHWQLGIVLAEQGRIAEALATFETGLKDYPQSPELLNSAAMAASLTNDFAAAVKYQRRAIRSSSHGQAELLAILRRYEYMAAQATSPGVRE
jgi:tetratricopeptide (TPR) repeat protein